MNGQVAAQRVVQVINGEPEFVIKDAATFRVNISQKHRHVSKGDVQVCHVILQSKGCRLVAYQACLRPNSLQFDPKIYFRKQKSCFI